MTRPCARRSRRSERNSGIIQRLIIARRLCNLGIMSKDANPPPNPSPGDIPVGKLVNSPSKPKAAAPAEPAKPAKKAAPPAALAPATAPPPPPATQTIAEYDVELVAIPFPPANKPRLPRDQRPLYDLDRRDFIMLGGGLAGAVIAILAAMGLARVVRRKPFE